MATPFKPGRVRSMTGFLDLRRSPDEVGLSGFTMLLNASVRGRGKRCRRGGWNRLMKGVNPIYNNEDLHDQLLELIFNYDSYSQQVFLPAGVAGYGYPYFAPSQSTPGQMLDESLGFLCGYAPDYAGIYNYPAGPEGYGIGWDPFIGWPYELKDDGLYGCDSGPPFHYPASYFELLYSMFQPGTSTPGYAYGDPFPIMRNPSAYLYEYCGDQKHLRSGCQEAITFLSTVGDVEGNQHLLAGTKSRLYTLNPAFGNWRVIADGLGTRVKDCDACSQERFMSANLDNTVIFVNGVNPVLAYNTLAPASGCAVWRAREIDDLKTLRVASAAVVGSWKGFIFLGDVQQDGFRHRNRMIWSDHNNPVGYVPDDDSLAGYQDLGTDETILRIEPLNDYLFIFTDKSIYRAALVELGAGAGFVFEELYRGKDALFYKHSLVNTGDVIFYWTNSRLVAFTSLDKRPIEPDWIRAFSNGVIEGVTTDDISFGPVNNDLCGLFTGGWNPDHKEVWWSWVAGDADCPNMSLVVNLTNREEGADFVDHGFTAFKHWNGGQTSTLINYLESLQICPREALLPDAIKEGPPVIDSSVPFPSPPLYLWNAENDWSLPNGPFSVCQKLEELWVEDVCTDCKNLTRFVMADAWDRALKEYADDHFAREVLTGNTYHNYGYSTVMQSGAEDFGISEDKLTDLITVNYVAEPQTTPNLLYAYIGLSQQPTCHRWQHVRFYDENGDLQDGRELRCLTDKSHDEHDTDSTRSDLDAKFPTQSRAKFIAYKLKINGTGGGACFSGVELKTTRIEHY
jgi:hypothetical protein